MCLPCWSLFKALLLPPLFLPSYEGTRMKDHTGGDRPFQPTHVSDTTLEHPVPDEPPASCWRTSQLTH